MSDAATVGEMATVAGAQEENEEEAPEPAIMALLPCVPVWRCLPQRSGAHPGPPPSASRWKREPNVRALVLKDGAHAAFSHHHRRLLQS